MNSHTENTSGRRIAFVGFGSFSQANPNLAAALRRRFSNCEIDWIDAGQLGEQRKLIRALAWGHVALEFARDIGLDPWQLKRRLPWTTYLFRQRGRIAAEQVARKRYVFSLQTQSLFDASVPSLPHFVYTDNTMLANLQYGETTALFAPEMRWQGKLPVTEDWIAQERRLYHNARACFVMSSNIRRSLVDDYGCSEDKVICAYAGANMSVQGHHSKSYHHKNILFVGLDWERKGGPELLAAFRLVRARIPDASLTVIGCSPRVEQPGCHIVGRIPPSELSRYYAAASVFCLPTRHEPFGFVFVEAMSHKLPIVATNVGAIPDFVTNGVNGFCISPGDPDGLAEALILLLRNPPRCRQMGEQNYAVSQRYSWDNVTSIMASTIQRLVPELTCDLAVGGSQISPLCTPPFSIAG